MKDTKIELKYIILDGSLEFNKTDEVIQFKKEMAEDGIYTVLNMRDIINICDEAKKKAILAQAVIMTDNDELDVNCETYKHCAVLGVGLLYHGNAPYVTLELSDTDKEYILLVYNRKHGIPMVIGHTQHLLIREMCMDDIDNLFSLYDSLSDCPYIERLYERTKEEEYSRKYIENMYGFYNYGLWLIFLKNDFLTDNNKKRYDYFNENSYKLIGRAGIEHREIDGELCHEIGYLIDKVYQGRGYAYEACTFIIGYAGVQLGIDKLYACIHKDNYLSQSLAVKLGFTVYKEMGDDIIYTIKL